MYTAPGNSSAIVCHLVLANSSQLPALWGPWLLLTVKRCAPGIVPPSNTAGTSQGSISGGPFVSFRTPSIDCWVVLGMCDQWQWRHPDILCRHHETSQTDSTIHSNVAGAVQSPRGITTNCHSPWPVDYAAISLSFRCSAICQYSLSRSSLENHFALASVSRVSSILGSREQPLFLTLFSFL